MGQMRQQTGPIACFGTAFLTVLGEDKCRKGSRQPMGLAKISVSFSWEMGGNWGKGRP